MPRRVDPGTIVTTSGSGSGRSATVSLGDFPALAEHLSADSGAHPATAVTVDAIPGVISAVTVEGAIDELSALVPKDPPRVGEFDVILGEVGIPDWGVLKLTDTPPATDNDRDALYVFPAYYTGPELAVGDDFPTSFNDPVSDVEFNVYSASYLGGGSGASHAGAFHRSGETVVSHRIGLPQSQCVVSGIVFPADRGVLALVHWDPGETLGAVANAAELSSRVLAAILLGAGANSTSGCDGASPAPGLDTGLAYYGGGDDPTSFPGMASGQYNLDEIHTATRFDASGPLPAPFDVADSSAGQVRLGTDPAVGPVVVNGIPILGGTTSARGGGNDNNFFAYRLPALSDYTTVTGIPWTPSAEVDRYLATPAISSSSELSTAGGYTGFNGTYWGHQVARYRHAFALGSGDLGGYALIHFKTEGAFEQFALNGTPPSASDVYSAQTVDYDTLENVLNLSTGYHALRSSLYLDASASSAHTLTTDTFDYSSVVDDVMYVSGVSYHVPQSSDGTANFVITDMDVLFEDAAGAGVGETGFWESTFFTHDGTMTPFGDDRDAVTNRNPVALYLGSMSVDAGSIQFTGGTLSAESDVRPGRVEFNYLALNHPSTSWAGSEPTPTDHAGFDLSGGDTVEFAGDVRFPRFSEKANPKLMVRRPTRPADSDVLYTLDEGSGKAVLFHSAGSSTPQYGNFEDATVEVSNVDVGVVADVSAGTMPASFSFSVLTQGSLSEREVTRVVCGPSSALTAAGAGDYFVLTTPGSGAYYFWFNVAGGNSDPAPGGTGVEVQIQSTTLPASAVAAEIRRTISSVVDLYVEYPYGMMKPLNSLYSGIKDVEERFLDEVYRYFNEFVVFPTPFTSSTGLPTLSAGILNQLRGPGLPTVGSVDFPVRPLFSTRPEYSQVAFFPTAAHRGDLSTFLPTWSCAQVRGLPDREAPYQDGAVFASPSAGRLTYPLVDYTGDYRPSKTDADLTYDQPDYSGVTGSASEVSYVRAFDIGFNQIGFENHVGESEFILRLRGITFEDVAYAVPGPGSLGLSVQVKIPGLTTWCDVGRADGEGPSKQSTTEDGAGCAILSAAETYDGIDDEGVVFTQIRCNLSPGTFFLNSDGEQPVLVRVLIKDTVAGRQLDFERHDGSDSVTVSNTRLRGLIGMSIVRETEAYTTTSYLNQRLDSGLEDVEALDAGVVAVYET